MSDRTDAGHDPGHDQSSPHDQGGQGHQGGLAGALARAFINSPLSPLLLIASLGLGIFGLVATPRQEDPQISVPTVDVFISYPGASAQQVESLVAQPVERLMDEITGVDHVYSMSSREQALITVQYKVGEELENSLFKLYDKLQSNLDAMPPGVKMPLVKPKGADDVPVVTVTLWSREENDATLRLIGLDVLQAISEVPDSSQGFVTGGRSETITVEVLPQKLSGFDISVDRLAEAIRSANAANGVGHVEIAGQHLSVYSGAFLRTASDLQSLIVGTAQGEPVYLRDIARVRDGPEETQRLVNYYSGEAYDKCGEYCSGEGPVNGASAVTIAIAKKTGSNGVTVANGVIEKVRSLEGRLIPDNIHVAITRDYGKSAKDKVNELIFKLFVATGAVTVLVLIALGWRASITVAVVIPIVILSTVFGALVLGYTIDRVSLFALIFSIGILVDDAIVVVENIYRRWLIEGNTSAETSVDAVAEVGNPTILATFTVIAALLPMGFVTGMMGPYMEPIPALGSIAMVFSLFAAFIFTPWLAQRIRPSMRALRKAEASEERQQHWLGDFFRRVLVPLFNDRKKGFGFLFGIIALFFISMSLFYFTAVPVKMLPFDNKSEFQVVINMPEGTPLPETANLTALLAEELRSVDEVVALQTYVGTASPFNFNGLVRRYYLRSQPWQADIQLQLTDKHEHHRKRSSHEIASSLRDRLRTIVEESGSGARIEIVEMPPGPPVLQAVVAEVYAPTKELRRAVANDLEQMFEQASHITDVDTLMNEPYERWTFEVDAEKATRRGISVETINRTLNMVMGDFKLGDVKRESVLEPTFIVLQAPLGTRSQFARLGELPIPTQDGRQTVPLRELGRFVKEPEDDYIFHKDLRPVEYVTGNTLGRLGAPIYGMFQINDMLSDYTAPDGSRVSGTYTGPPGDGDLPAFEWGGEWTVTYETFRDMGIAFAVALVLIYMLVVWEFGNFVLPAIVMAPIPLTLIGIVPGHAIMGAQFTATSMIGFIALAGIIVRNSILLVDFTRQQVYRGVPVMEATIRACQARTRPIMITALALVAGSFVILFDPIFQGMAVALMFGVLVSTLLTLIVIPLGLISAEKALAQGGPTDDGPGGPGDGGPDPDGSGPEHPGSTARASGAPNGAEAASSGMGEGPGSAGDEAPRSAVAAAVKQSGARMVHKARGFGQRMRVWLASAPFLTPEDGTDAARAPTQPRVPASSAPEAPRVTEPTPGEGAPRSPVGTEGTTAPSAPSLVRSALGPRAPLARTRHGEVVPGSGTDSAIDVEPDVGAVARGSATAERAPTGVAPATATDDVILPTEPIVDLAAPRDRRGIRLDPDL